ncbi:hypothetical protein BDV93DRAFT_556123 [Ceratobasidium sp. AG-I]|nr:hypothetical protein BDV93DRAFT_556123 [Ceratobasidium sp. AG-I]
MSIPNDLKEIIDRGLIIPHDNDFENLSAHVLADAGGVFEKLASGLKSRQREYKLKHSPAIPPSISRLLVCFKSLGQALISWSNGTMSEKAVSDVFITVDHAFETVISAFQGRGIDVSDLLPLPEKLRQVLKWTLAEVPTPDNWERHKPSIGAIVKKLLICVIEKDKDDRLTIDVWCPSNQEALDELDGDWSLVPPPLPAKVMDESKEYGVQPAIIESSRPPAATLPTRVVLIEVPGLDPLASSASLIQPKQEDGMVKEKGFKRPLILSRLRERIALVFGPADAKYKKSMSRVDGFA